MNSFTFDRDAAAMYLTVRKGKVEKTIEVKGTLLMDVDKKGKMLGLEVLLPSIDKIAESTKITKSITRVK